MDRAAPVLILSLCLTACGHTVTPPPEARTPAAVAVLDHGRHSSLLVSTGDGAMIRYAYGDWHWYAINDKGFLPGLRALFLPSRGALARRRYPAPVSPEAVARHVEMGIEKALYFRVEAARARALVARLDRRFFNCIDRAVANPRYGLVFVPHPAPYTLFNNSNTRLAGWLEDLGIRVRGWALSAHWRIEEPG